MVFDNNQNMFLKMKEIILKNYFDYYQKPGRH